MRLGTIFIVIVLSLLSATVAVADTKPLPLNQITLQLNVEDWVTAKTAKVTVAMNAALSKKGLEEIHKDLFANLNKIAAGADWHITVFERSKDQSGLEQVHIMAEARMTEDKLPKLRDAAKAVSKPGENYEVTDIDFSPSLAEFEEMHKVLRGRIYSQAKTELAAINQLYPEQHYFLHTINFNVSATPRPMMVNKMMVGVAGGESVESSAVVVSNRVQETAMVVLASKPEATSTSPAINK